MSKQKNSISVFILTLSFLMCISVSAECYVLQGEHIIQLVIEKNKFPGNFFLNQILRLYDKNSDDVAAEYEQWVRYSLPEKFRSDINTDGFKHSHVVSADLSVTIVDESIVAESETWIEHYKDLFFFKSRKRFVERLEALGVNLNVTSIGRFKNNICYIIGAEYLDETVPQVWVLKDTFRPVRWICGTFTSPDGGIFINDIHYNNWNTYDGSWYPSEIQFYHGLKLVQSIEIRQIQKNSHFSDELFDVNQIKGFYSINMSDIKPQKEKSDIEQHIEDFKKIYE